MRRISPVHVLWQDRAPLETVHIVWNSD
jgi:hypothetical protein